MKLSWDRFVAITGLALIIFEATIPPAPRSELLFLYAWMIGVPVAVIANVKYARKKGDDE